MQADAITFDPDAWPACWILDMIARNGDCSEFYHHRIWKKKRRQVVRDQHAMCWACQHPEQFPHLAGKLPALTMGNTVHHMLPVRERPDLCLSDTAPDGSQNLVVLCPSCHWQIHHDTNPLEIPERW